jgi:hypothetical protein
LAKIRRHRGLLCQMERAASSHSMLIPPNPISCTGSPDLRRRPVIDGHKARLLDDNGLTHNSIVPLTRLRSFSRG